MEAMDFMFGCTQATRHNGMSVGVIGAGPSGLAAAGHLACKGFSVEVYDKLPKPGGLLLFGIPGHRIPRERVDGGVRLMEEKGGVVFHSNTKVCCSAPLFEEEGDHFCSDMLGLGDMVKRHDAIIICTGSWKSRKLDIEGEDLAGVHSGLEFLFPIRAAAYGNAKVKAIDVAGRAVAVIGAGHSAVDVAHAALHLGAAKVFLPYRRTRTQAPCGSFEVDRLVDAGVEFLERATPRRIVGGDRVEGLEIECEGEVRVMPCDIVVTAIGEKATPPFAKELGLENVRAGEVKWLHMTAIENVFVAGDALSGPSKIGKAVYSGLRAASSLANWLDLKSAGRLSSFHDEGFVADDEARVRKDRG